MKKKTRKWVKMPEIERQKIIMDILYDVVLHPQKHFWMANSPGRYDTAVYLYTEHYDSLPAKVRRACEKWLLYTGKWEWEKEVPEKK